ncbi:hypothetical protein NHQ30_011637 [Ciborinia camelliae]|nr:hypothetical protein NHQ30_011637 [Ciborinia camelliae]
MVTSIATLTTFLVVGLVSSSPIKARTPYAVKETHYPPSQWQRVGPARAGHMINLQIGLKQGQFDELERHLYEVSDPSHQRYGQHLSAQEVNDLVKPSDETHDLVHEWLQDNNIEASSLEYSPAKDWIKVTIAIEDIETLLDTKYSTYKHEDGEYIVRTPEWSLPLHLHDHIETIQPTNSFFRPRAVARSMKKVDDVTGYQALAPSTYKPPTVGQTAADVCNVSAVTPLCLRTLYGTVDYKVQAADRNKMALTDYLGESNNRSDTKLFLEQYRPEAASAAYSFDVQIINGGNDEQTPENATELAAGKDLEGNLDSETMLGIGYPTPLIAYTTGGSPPFNPDLATPTDTNEPYLTWLQYVLSQKDLPGVVSNSYQDTEQTVPYSYAVSVCKGFAQLGARGVSVLFGSGDNGVGEDGTCVSNVDNSTTFLAMFPSTCPYVTSVGGTKFINPEVVATDARNGYVSGGGFSRYFPRPAWQDAALKPYLASLPKNITAFFNATGRGFPDIAAQGYHFITIWNGTIVPLDGTSAATPTASAILALVNDALIAAGKPTLGWLNPWLYSKGYAAFTDVTVGSSKGCGTDGFPAAVGWDAATGFGTPRFKSNGPFPILHLSVALSVVVIIYGLSTVIYNIYFHPLSKFPGPKLFAASRIFSIREVLRGELPHKITAFHEIYGEVVRTAPDELSFTSPQAFQDIYAKKNGKPSFPKDPIQYTMAASGSVPSILGVISDKDHSRYRRLLAHAFSEKALREQEPLIKHYVDLLITRLHQNSTKGPQNMVNWYNFTTFDVIADLTFGESFGCLDGSDYHPWVSFMFRSFKAAAFMAAAKRFGPIVKMALDKFIPKKLLEQRTKHRTLTHEKVQVRLERKTERKDFMTYILRHNDVETGMTVQEIKSTAGILLLAGSETTATLLSAVTYYLLTPGNEHILKCLVEEIRTMFKTEEEIDMISVNKLKYQLAVLDEAMRIHPPAPFGGPRVVPGDGQFVSGYWVPGGTNVSCGIYASQHQTQNFKNPDKFAPERWLDDPEYAGDEKGAFQPFSLGPRNCIGRNLAYAEMRLILARVIWNFDLELAHQSMNWAKHMKIFLLWEKPPLFVTLKPVVRE